MCQKPRILFLTATVAMALLFLLSGASGTALAQSDAKPQKSKLVIIVVKAEDASPVPGARVYVTGANGIDRSTKTNKKGKAAVPKLPHQEVTVQVIATGFETAGKKITLSQKVEKVTITLKKSAALPDFSSNNFID